MNRLIDSLSNWNINISAEQAELFDLYYHLLIEWNEKINLTAITDKDDVIDKHFIDSSALIKYVDLKNKSLIDVGTGAGFPGIPLKILVPECNITLLDSLNKRVNFLNEVISKLSLKGINAVHGRAEDFAVNPSYRESFDFVTSRAVANLSTLSEYCLPFTKINGYFIPYKSGEIDNEVSNASNALSILGGKVDKIEKYNLYGTDYDRSLVFIKKCKKCSNKYPRKAGVPSKMPLS